MNMLVPNRRLPISTLLRHATCAPVSLRRPASSNVGSERRLQKMPGARAWAAPLRSKKQCGKGLSAFDSPNLYRARQLLAHSRRLFNCLPDRPRSSLSPGNMPSLTGRIAWRRGADDGGLAKRRSMAARRVARHHGSKWR